MFTDVIARRYALPLQLLVVFRIDQIQDIHERRLVHFFCPLRLSGSELMLVGSSRRIFVKEEYGPVLRSDMRLVWQHEFGQQPWPY